MWFEQTKKTAPFSSFFQIGAFFFCFSRRKGAFCILFTCFSHKYCFFCLFFKKGGAFFVCSNYWPCTIDRRSRRVNADFFLPLGHSGPIMTRPLGKKSYIVWSSSFFCRFFNVIANLRRYDRSVLLKNKKTHKHNWMTYQLSYKIISIHDIFLKNNTVLRGGQKNKRQCTKMFYFYFWILQFHFFFIAYDYAVWS